MKIFFIFVLIPIVLYFNSITGFDQKSSQTMLRFDSEESSSPNQVNNKTDTLNQKEATWSADSTGYNLYVHGERKNTKNEWRGNDLLVFVPTERLYFLFRDYNNKKDNQLRPAEFVNSPSGTLWSADSTGYILYVNGECKSTINAWHDNDLLVFIPSQRLYFLLQDFDNKKDNQLRPAESILTSNGTLWSTDGTDYYFYVNGEAIQSRTKSVKRSFDLLVFDPLKNKYYLFKNYSMRKNNLLRPAKSIESPNGTLWSASSMGYSLYVNGEAIQGRTENELSDYDLIVSDPEKNMRYLLKNYEFKKDNTLRPAEILLYDE
ncbi:hypothetical protein JW964_27805 [candidate division KSB1 bacterium]|nr:hypothetical protein [candidate division KSB1 bacterium]